MGTSTLLLNNNKKSVNVPIYLKQLPAMSLMAKRENIGI